MIGRRHPKTLEPQATFNSVSVNDRSPTVLTHRGILVRIQKLVRLLLTKAWKEDFEMILDINPSGGLCRC